MPAAPSDRVPTPGALWRHARAGLRRALAEAAWDEAGLREDLIRAATAHFHMREQSLRTRAAGVERVQKLPQIPETLALDLSKNYLFREHRRLLGFFLDRLGLSHEDGVLAASPPPPEAARLQAAVAALQQPESGFPAELVQLYLITLHASDPAAWGGLAPWLQAPSEPAAPPTAGPGPGAAPAEPPAAGDHSPRSPKHAAPPPDERFTTLDRVVMQAIVAGVSEIEGALPAANLQELVEEVRRLNPSRHRSYFHLGFLHALQHRPVQRSFAGGNPDRRRWYLAGVVAGHAREENWPAIAALQQAGELTQLGRELDQQAREAAPWILEALMQTGMAAALAEFLNPRLVAAVGDFDKLFQYARRLFQQGRLAETEAILELLIQARPQLPADADVALEEVERLRAHCLQWQGRLEPALAILGRLLASPHLQDRAAVMTDVAMAEHGLRGLFDVQLREPGADLALQGQLAAMRPQLEAAAAAPGRHGHARFCLGVLALLSESYPQAVTHLDAALAAFLQTNPLYEHFELPQRCQFYLAVALFGSSEPGAGDRALELMEAALGADFRPPSYLLRVAAMHAMLCPQPQIEALAEIVVSRLGEKALDALIDLDRPACAPLLKRLLQRGQDASRRTEARMQDLLLVVRQAPAADESGLQAQALDALEELARRAPAAAATGDLLALLTDESAAAYDPAWETSDAIWAAAEVRDRRGEPARAAELLVRLGFRLLHEGGWGAAAEAAELARRAQALGADVQQLLARLETASPPPAAEAPAPPARPVRIAIIGGDEHLAAMEARIRGQLQERDPQVSVDFCPTNWSSNWGRQFDRLKPSLGGYQAIVVLRRIRTQLGRLLRREHPCWVGCAGASPADIARAALLAAELARGGAASFAHASSR